MRLSLWMPLFGVLLFLSSGSFASVIDDFEDGSIAPWTMESPYYTSVSIATPGSGGVGKALAIQEIPGSEGGRSRNALAHRHFQSPQNWSAYTTLEMDVAISSGPWNGYSIRVYNNGKSVFLRGIHGDATVPGFQTVQFDLSGIARTQIDEIVIYVNRTAQNAGQTLYLDNLRLSNNTVSSDPVWVVEDFSSGNLAEWASGGTPAFVLLGNLNENSPWDASQPARSLSSQLNTNSANALFRWQPAKAMDWFDYTTLEFDVKLTVGTNLEGFSVRLYNASSPVRLKKFIPGTDWVTCQVDISEMDRDQVNEVLFYVNRTRGYDPAANPSRPQTFVVDNIRLTRNALPPVPEEVTLANWDDGDFFPWDRLFNTTILPNSFDFVSAPFATDIKLVGVSGSAYARQNFLYGNQPYQDWNDYKSLVFEAKVTQGIEGRPDFPIGFSAQIVNGGIPSTNSAGPGGGPLWFYPSGYNVWETHRLDISSLDLDQVSWIWWYVNRALRNDWDGFTAQGQIVTIDNVRLSRQSAPALNIDSPFVDDFEDGDIADWYYSSFHEYPAGSGEFLNGVKAVLTNDASEGQYALKITHQNPPANPFAYSRKTLHNRWNGYRTLQFDAKVSDSNTSAGYTVRLRSFNGYARMHQFTPTEEWQTFKIDISDDKAGVNDARNEVIGLLFYVNRPGAFAQPQNGNQSLYLDNIRLTNEAVKTSFTSIGDAKTARDGAYISIKGKVSAGSFEGIFPDKENPTNLRPVFFIVEDDRSSGIPVVVSQSVTSIPDISSGTKVDVTGELVYGFGNRYLYATAINVAGSGFQYPEPVYLSNQNLGSAGRGLDAGIEGFSGLDTTGLFAQISGKVLSIGSDLLGRRFLYIDDGSGVAADNARTGVKVYDWNGDVAVASNIGRFVKATGFVINEPELDASTFAPTGRVIRSFWPKRDIGFPIQLAD